MDAAVGCDAVVDARRRLDAAVENDGELASDVFSGDLSELTTALGAQREADGGLIVLVEARARVP